MENKIIQIQDGRNTALVSVSKKGIIIIDWTYTDIKNLKTFLLKTLKGLLINKKLKDDMYYKVGSEIKKLF